MTTRLLFCFTLAVTLAGCQRVIRIDQTSPVTPMIPQSSTAVLSSAIQQAVPLAIQDSLSKYGFPINKGLTPPPLADVYFCQPNLLVSSSFREDRADVGTKLYNPTKFRFRNFDLTKLTAILDYKEFSDVGGTMPTGTTGGGTNGNLSGSGSKFTLFVNVSGTTSVVRNGRTLTATTNRLDSYSGEMTSTGIKNLVWSLYIKSKNDPDLIVAPVGTTRVFRDRDGFSEKVSTF